MVATSEDYSEGAPDEGAVDALPVRQISAHAGAGERVDRFLTSQLPGVSRSRVQQWIGLGAVWCDERPLAAKTRLAGHETLYVQPLPREADRAFEPDDVALQIVFEDAALLVLDKPAGLVVHPAPGNWRGTVMNGLLHHRPALAQIPRAGIVHRLDKDTSGLMVVGKTEAACGALVAQLADRSMSRRYLAIVRGITPPKGRIAAPIGRDVRQRLRMAVVPAGAGKDAVTHFERMAQGRIDGHPASLVICTLETGRTHQIRVHLASLGHPLLGDSLYGGPDWGIARQALHAWALGLIHPVSRASVRWYSRPPADLDVLAARLGVDLTAQVRQWSEVDGERRE
jgi:23S rRNA pseudouridine1911/1915/1917 synthase